MQWSLILLFLMGRCCFIDCQLYEFHYIDENKTWTEAQQYCREKHTDLITVTNMKDMKRLLSKSPGTMREAWIGLYDQTDGTRKWYWSLPGLEFNESETSWNEGEPRTLLNCGHMLKINKWISNPCMCYFFLCYNERDTSTKYHLIQDLIEQQQTVIESNSASSFQGTEKLKSWLEAQSYCREKHTDLISGMEQLQDEEVKKLMNSLQGFSVCIGLFSDTWRWSDGSNSSFRHWNLQFNNDIINSGQCATTVFDDGGRWRNENCNKKKPFICYDDKVILIKKEMNWEDALYYCRDHHHDLVTITNMDDQIWIQEKVKEASTDYVWMGLRYTCTLDFWFWVSDEVVSYKNWAKGEPMDDCDMSGAMETGGGHKWFKRNDADLFNFLCSKN